jgi:hypothetical protein
MPKAKIPKTLTQLEVSMIATVAIHTIWSRSALTKLYLAAEKSFDVLLRVQGQCVVLNLSLPTTKEGLMIFLNDKRRYKKVLQ